MTNDALRAQVENLTEEISRQKELLDELEARLDQLRAQLDSTTYPVLTLPVEITTLIFVHCISLDIDLHSTKRPALLLMQVCRAWKGIALATTELWSRFHADLEDLYSCSESFTRVLNRTGGCTLDVILYRTMPLDERFWDHVNTLDQFCSRIRCLDLNMSLEIVQKLGGYVLSFPALERLVIRDEEDTDEDEEDIQLADYRIEVFKHSPRLRAVELRVQRNARVIPLFALDLPWQQLTHFGGGQFDLADCLEALDRMPNLTVCNLDVLVTSKEHPHSRHSNIQHLRIEGRSNPRIFEHLTLPSLRTLAFPGQSLRNFRDSESLSAFLERSAPPLRKLSIGNDRGSTTLHLSRQLTAFALTELEIFQPAVWLIREFFSAFSVDPTFFPQLQDLVFRDCSQADTFDGRAGVLTTAKRAAEAINQARLIRVESKPLRSLRIYSVPGPNYHNHIVRTSEFPEEVVCALRALRQSGMKIHVGTNLRSFI